MTRRPPAALAAFLIAALATALLVSPPFGAPPASGAFEFEWPDAASASTLSLSAIRLTSPESEGRQVTVSSGRLYGMREMTGWSVSAGFAGERGAVTLCASSFGSYIYKEGTLAVAASRDVRNGLEICVRGRALTLSADGLEQRWSLAADASVRRTYLGRLTLGVAGRNITRSDIGGSPVSASTSVFLRFSLPDAALACSVLLEDDLDPSPGLGGEVRLSDWARVRAGVGTEPGRFALGLGLGRAARVWPELDIAWQWHPRLGGSMFASVIFRP